MHHLNIDYVRSCFPAFEQPLPSKTAFFENAGGSYVAGPVLKKYFQFYTENKVQPFGASEICRVAGEQMDEGRQTMADLLGVPIGDITIGPSTTQNLNTLAIACASIVKKADTVIVSGQDHEANFGAWERLCNRTGATLRTWDVDKQGELNITDLEVMIDSSVKIICMTHSSNIVGTVNPVEQVIKFARPLGIRVVLDGVSYAPHSWPNISQIRPDAYCFSTYKTYATHLGIMFVAPDFAADLDPQCHYFNIMYPEKRFDSAGPDHASIAALSGLGDYFSSSHEFHYGKSDKTLFSKAQEISLLMNQHENVLCRTLLDEIKDLPLKIVGRCKMQGREANIALYSDVISSHAISQALAHANIAAGNGHFYAKRLMQSIGIKDLEDGVLRVSFSHYNSEMEVVRVIEVLRNLFVKWH